MNIGDVVVVPDVECMARMFTITEKKFSERKDVNEYRAVEKASGEVLPFDGRIKRSNFIMPLDKYNKIIDKNCFLIAQIEDGDRNEFYILMDGKLTMGDKGCTFENQRYGAEFYHKCATKIADVTGSKVNPYTFWTKCSKLCIGMTLDEIFNFIDEDPYKFMRLPDYKDAIRDLIVTINRPEISRYDSEDGNRGFNVVRVEVLLKRYAYPEILKHIEDYKQEIIDIVLESVAESAEFKKLDVPVEYLVPYKLKKLSADDLLFDFKLPE